MAEFPTMAEIIPYSISIDEFRSKKERLYIPKYQLGEFVTLENFAAFLENGFAKSLGIASTHYIYCYWNMLHTGFDYLTSCNNCLSAGGWRALELSEQTNLYSGYEQVAKYLPLKHNARNFQEFGLYIDNQLTKLARFERTEIALNQMDLTCKELIKLDEKEISKIITQYAKKIKAKKNTNYYDPEVKNDS